MDDGNRILYLEKNVPWIATSFTPMLQYSEEA